MQCDKVRELLSPFLDGELTPEQRLAVDSHLVECSSCATELLEFQSISAAAVRMDDPTPPVGLWESVNSRLNRQPPGVETAALASSPRSRRRATIVAVSAVLLFAAALTVALRHWIADEDHKTVNLDRYLTEFASDPEVAQNKLISQFENQEVNIQEATDQLRYQPVAAGRLPDGVTVRSMRIFNMPCCRCLQTVCRADGKHTIVIYEHADEHSFDFGRRPSMKCDCRGRKSRIVQFDGQMVASFAKGGRYLTLVGARDLDQVVRFVERLK